MAYTSLRLPRLGINWDKQPQLFERYWDDAMTRVEGAINSILVLPDIQAAIAAAQADVDNLAIVVEEVSAGNSSTARETSLTTSYPSFVGSLITANSSGDVTIATHDRVYGDPTADPTVSVTGATLTGIASSGDVVRVYYTDPTRAGGSVTYLYTIDPALPMSQTGDTHCVGAVSIPASGTTDGVQVRPPGYVQVN